MKNKIRKINIFIILLLTILLVIPKDVNAAEVTCDSEKYANFWCSYTVPESDLFITNGKVDYQKVAAHFSPLGILGGATYATHHEFNITYHICTDGHGGMRATLRESGTDGYKLDAAVNTVIENPKYFYDSTTGLGKCPTLYIRVDNNYDSNLLDGLPIVGDSFNGSIIKVRKTLEKVGCTSITSCDPCLNCTVYTGVEAEVTNNNNKPFWAEEEQKKFEEFNDCTAILGTEPYSLGWLIKKALFYIKIAAPILVLLLSSIDFVKAIIINDDDTMKKAQKKLIIRIIVAILLLIIPTLVDLLLDVFGFTASKCIL